MREVSGDAGFTLVEMLVSMALLGMAAVLVAQGFSADKRLLGAVEGRASAADEVAAAQDAIRDHIEHLFPQTQFDSAGPHLVMTGSPRDLEFMTFGSRNGEVAQIEDQTLALNQKGDLSLASQAGAEAGAEGGKLDDGGRALLHGVQSIELAYYGQTGADGHPGWKSAWAKENTVPQLVRVRLNFVPGDRRVWPELIVRPAVTVDTACILDVTTGSCRGRQ